MPTKVTYYAIVNDYSSRDEPGGVLRRVEDENAEYDEQYGRDLAWTRSPLLYSYERGNLDNQLYEISEDEANRIVERIRRSVGERLRRSLQERGCRAELEVLLITAPYDGRVAASAGVVLAGGRSSRMGTPKAALEWHGSTLLYRTVGIVARATSGPVVVVRASGQELPDLPQGTQVVDDPRQGKGPVQGITAGLAALEGRAEAAFVCSTDMPFLHPAFIRRVLRVIEIEDDARADVALPVARGYPQPLAAAYRVSLAATAERLVKEDRLRPAFLFSECAVARLDDAALQADPLIGALDPDLDSVVNINTAEDYLQARARPAPKVTVQLFGALAKGDGILGPQSVRAATVDAAASAVCLMFDRHVTAALNGDQITRDGATPLVTGDSVYFMPADAGG